MGIFSKMEHIRRQDAGKRPLLGSPSSPRWVPRVGKGTQSGTWLVTHSTPTSRCQVPCQGRAKMGSARADARSPSPSTTAGRACDSRSAGTTASAPAARKDGEPGKLFPPLSSPCPLPPRRRGASAPRAPGLAEGGGQGRPGRGQGEGRARPPAPTRYLPGRRRRRTWSPGLPRGSLELRR